MSVRKPGSLVLVTVLKGDIVSVKLDRTVLVVLQAAQRLLASHGASNKTLAKMASSAALDASTQTQAANKYRQLAFSKEAKMTNVVVPHDQT